MLEAKRRAAIFLLLAFILAAVAGYLVLEKVKQLNAELGGMVEIYVSNGDIPARTLLHESQLTKMEIPQKFLTASHITDKNDILGQVSVVPLKEGDIITDNMLKSYSNLQDENNRLVALYRTDKIQFDQEIAALDRVDIIVSLEEEGKKSTELFMKDVAVAFAQGTGENFAGIGVEVSSEDATKLIHMENYAEYIRVLKANVGQDVEVSEVEEKPASVGKEEAPAESTETQTETKTEDKPNTPTDPKSQTNTEEAPASNTNAKTSEGNS
ncbi:Flp pilus assembly protein CpaB [Lysinibacillus sp. SGAir0095]|uniref:Flp pilus assembly protein CpaB n=1 Tax=Lysinibacillus sp. SGAir0095 TaxID=2070463 RepID=UPI0010CD4F03|nr:SAF domain-containing protein [Lysinibacillus sp. SGAir0095]QCR31534.1 flp pilus assembly protein CpaB [Lysinibacillus sp. SGAir0095]